MKTSDKGVALIKRFEGLRLKSYPDPGTGGDPWTIGYGHTGGIRRGMEITEAQADAFLRSDLARFEQGVANVAAKFTQGQFDALVSFSFNVGLGNLMSSTLLKKHKAGEYQAAADQFLRWNRAAGKILPGLTKRRAAERELYLS